MWLVTMRIWAVTRTGSAANAPPHSASARTANRASLTGWASLVVLVLVEPRHLNRLEFGFVRLLGIVAELVEFRDPFVQVGEANVGWVLIGVLLAERERDIFEVTPRKFRHRFSSPSARLARRCSSCSPRARESPHSTDRF